MRTKTLLLTAAISAVGLASSMAQAVYSVNVVGYHNVTAPVNQFTILANQLNAANSTLGALVPTAPLSSRVYKYAGGNYTISTFDEDDNGVQGWTNPGLTLTPGEGFWFRNGGTTPFNITFVGEVRQGSLSHNVPTGFSLQSSEVPQQAGITTVMNYQPNLADRVYFYRNGAYTIYTYDEDDNGVRAWTPTEPVPNVGEGFWISTTVAKSWARTFNITQ